VARYSPFVLKVPLNPNQPTKQPCAHKMCRVNHIDRILMRIMLYAIQLLQI